MDHNFVIQLEKFYSTATGNTKERKKIFIWKKNENLIRLNDIMFTLKKKSTNQSKLKTTNKQKSAVSASHYLLIIKTIWYSKSGNEKGQKKLNYLSQICILCFQQVSLKF